MPESETTPAQSEGSEQGEKTATVDVTQLTAEIDKWKSLARKHEARAKENAEARKELDAVRAESMTEQEKAVAEAVAAARAEVLAEVGAHLVDAEVKAAATGRGIDVEALLDGLDRKRFLGEDGKPDVEAITQWIERLSPKQEKNEPRFPDLGQGQRGRSSMPLNGDPLLRDLKTKLNIP